MEKEIQDGNSEKLSINAVSIFLTNAKNIGDAERKKNWEFNSLSSAIRRLIYIDQYRAINQKNQEYDINEERKQIVLKFLRGKKEEFTKFYEEVTSEKKCLITNFILGLFPNEPQWKKIIEYRETGMGKKKGEQPIENNNIPKHGGFEEGKNQLQYQGPNQLIQNNNLSPEGKGKPEESENILNLSEPGIFVPVDKKEEQPIEEENNSILGLLESEDHYAFLFKKKESNKSEKSSGNDIDYFGESPVGDSRFPFFISDDKKSRKYSLDSQENSKKDFPEN